MPRALEILPSMPANPRLAKVSTPSRGVANASISLIGRDDETNNEEPLGKSFEISRAIVASFHPSSWATTFALLSPNFFHVDTQASSASDLSNSGIAIKRLSAVLSESTVAIRGSIT